MIPRTSDILNNSFTYDEPASKTYKLDIAGNSILGYTDGIDAIKQAVYLILNTERYKYLIYSWDYGIELEELYGMPIPYVLPELKRRITEALTQDTRIKDVSGFAFESRGCRVIASFNISTIYGDEAADMEVLI